MKVFHEIGNPCSITVADINGNHWEWNNLLRMPFDKALLVAEDIFAGQFVFNPQDIECLYIIDTDTGELLATCEPDEEQQDNYDDWDYDEDCGFDPYLGCYTDDC